ncbi:GL19520 [Drosophila persimilis]|uniref:Oligosaccharyltransferase complex subunit n=2 Tax=pseudoobscura subgroup TaxID=32358 RepID=B5DIJ4_DROPS|nr:putative oligosaccharyltransferase complex subunit CG9662 [Drosophila persimilis]XP_002132734.1 putative oligosaccharyltransferase complex subunit CG9662 [Drosophila pseudoobscura]EDW29077.1 GL19520 [Drosophila persimilis]
MIETLYSLPFHILVPPNIKVRRFSIPMPSPMAVFSVILLSYFLVTGGIIYDVIVEPPSVGATVDEHGHSRPVAFMPYRVNGQYIMEGLASSFLFTVGGLGFIIMDQTHSPGKTNLNRLLLTAMGFIFILMSFFTTWLFMRMKLPSYLHP